MFLHLPRSTELQTLSSAWPCISGRCIYKHFLSHLDALPPPRHRARTHIPTCALTSMPESRAPFTPPYHMEPPWPAALHCWEAYKHPADLPLFSVPREPPWPCALRFQGVYDHQTSLLADLPHVPARREPYCSASLYQRHMQEHQACLPAALTHIPVRREPPCSACLCHREVQEHQACFPDDCPAPHPAEPHRSEALQWIPELEWQLHQQQLWTAWRVTEMPLWEDPHPPIYQSLQLPQAGRLPWGPQLLQVRR
mmetsp:Transcript_26375/g.74219  ORF Transcript_26375/g.74219 Transcript_26375/m.74219 type:complete len:254 (-) Transcript_26375:2051-2812(-)